MRPFGYGYRTIADVAAIEAMSHDDGLVLPPPSRDVDLVRVSRSSTASKLA
jgi:hypothetical protein